jgi:hypothetical protein
MKGGGGTSTEFYKGAVTAGAILTLGTADESEWVRIAAYVCAALIAIAYVFARSAVKKANGKTA